MVLNMPETQQRIRYLTPHLSGGISQPASRQDLYEFLEQMYFNVAYETLGLAAFDVTLASGATTASIRGIYNVVSRIVDFYVKYVLTGRLGLAGTDADLTIETDNERIINPLLQIWKWSNLQTEKDLIPFYAANLGDCLLSVIDDAGIPGPNGKPPKVWIEVRHPGELVDYDFDSRGNLTYAKLESVAYERLGDGLRQSYVYGRIITKTEYRTEKDRAPYSFRSDGLTAWPNPHGFVPLVLIQHGRIGDEFGVNAYHHALAPIHELNLRASNLGDLLGEYLAPQWAVFGASLPTEGLPRDGQVWGFPQGSSAQALIADMRVTEAYVHINRIIEHLETLFPELILPKVLEKAQLTGPAVRGMLTDLIRNGETARDNYEAGLVRSGQMALSMSQNVAGTGRAIWSNLGAYAAGDFEHSYKFPDILPLSRLESLQVEAEEAALKREIEVGNPVVPAPFQAVKNGTGGATNGNGNPTGAAALLRREMGG